jgi:excinuclease UvrABC nuclease subunit
MTGHFVYTLSDSEGRPVYVGRSCKVRDRIRTHASEAKWKPEKAWVYDVRTVSMAGPYTRKVAIKIERDTIERLQPRGNRAMTARDHRPGVAYRSARRAS